MKTKRCYACKELKNIILFNLYTKSKDGRQGACKDCQREKQKISSKTVSGVITQMYSDQKKRQRDRNHGNIEFSKIELYEWCLLNGFNELYIRWVISGYKKDLKPSVDRINDKKGYSIGNIRLVTWLDNRNHQYADILKGIGTSGERCMAIVKYDSEMNEICEYISLSEAKRVEGYSMQWSVENGTKTRKGNYWKYR